MSDDDGLRSEISPADLSLLAAELGEIAASVDGVVHVRARPGFGSVVRSALQGLSAVVGGGGVVGSTVQADGSAVSGDGSAVPGGGSTVPGDGSTVPGGGSAVQVGGSAVPGDGSTVQVGGSTAGGAVPAPEVPDAERTAGERTAGERTAGERTAGERTVSEVPDIGVPDVELADPSSAEAAAAASPGRPVPLVGIAVADLETRITLDIAVDESGSGPLVARAVARALLDRVSGEPVPPASVDLRIVSVATGA